MICLGGGGGGENMKIKENEGMVKTELRKFSQGLGGGRGLLHSTFGRLSVAVK